LETNNTVARSFHLNACVTGALAGHNKMAGIMAAIVNALAAKSLGRNPSAVFSGDCSITRTKLNQLPSFSAEFEHVQNRSQNTSDRRTCQEGFLNAFKKWGIAED
jgi:hypothetical protein